MSGPHRATGPQGEKKMYKKQILLIAAMVGFTATVATAASLGDLKGPAVRKTLTGKTVYLSASGIVLPIAYRSNGTMSGQLQASAAALSGDASTKDAGRWWIARDQLCQRWNRWQRGKSDCYELSRQGQNQVWVRNDGRRGTASIGFEKRKTGDTSLRLTRNQQGGRTTAESGECITIENTPSRCC